MENYKYSYNEENINEIIDHLFNKKTTNVSVDILKNIKFDNSNKNQLDALRKHSEKLMKKVNCYSLNNEFINIYESLSEAARQTPATYQAISKCCSGKYNNYKTAGGFIWKYA